MIHAETTAVIAYNDIPVNVCVAASQQLLNLGQKMEEPLIHVDNVLKVWYENGMLTGERRGAWTQYVGAARDVHEQNLELNRESNGTLYLRTVRHIFQGEQLLTWYSPSLAMGLGIPTLSIPNIREAGCYRCLQCGYETGFPNILKSHMRFHCNKQTADLPDGHSPWKTVAVTQKPSTDILQNRTWKSTASQLNPFFENKVEIRSTHERKSCFSCTHNREREIPSFIKCNITYNAGNLKNPHELTTSVFVTSRDPDSNYICKSSSDNASCNKDLYSRMYSKTLRENTSSFIPSGGEHDKEQLDDFHNSLLELSSRRGHLCLYCGKFYSRKYGLKIHLRTHTGYKPLKCKVCKRPFGDPSNLNKHVRLHADGDTPYKCKHCGKVLVRKRDLARHIKSRHPESCR